MSFANILRDSTGTGSLLRLVESQLARSQTKIPLAIGHYIRASSVPSLCAREEVLCALHRFNRKDDVDAGLNLTFAHGTALHWAVQNQILGPMGVLYGTWRCDACSHLHGEGISPDSVGGNSRERARVADWAIPRPKTCSKCSRTEFTYVEHKFIDSTLRMSGHSDGFLVVPGLPGMGILEVKSIGQRSAREIQNVPQIAHVVQAHVYMMFTGFKWAKILYWQKGEFGLKALVEHHVERDEETIFRITQLVESVWSGIDDESLPERICASATCPRASSCQVAKLCFATS